MIDDTHLMSPYPLEPPVFVPNQDSDPHYSLEPNHAGESEPAPASETMLAKNTIVLSESPNPMIMSSPNGLLARSAKLLSSPQRLIDAFPTPSESCTDMSILF